MSSWTEERVERLKAKWGLVRVRSSKSQSGASQAPGLPATPRMPLSAPPQPVIERRRKYKWEQELTLIFRISEGDQRWSRQLARS